MRHVAALFVVSILAFAGWSEDWPAYLHDAARSGVTAEPLPAGLQPVWVHEDRLAPRPAWPAPANQDFWHELRELRPVVTYDRAYHAVIAGDALLFGSSAADRVYCLDAATGAERWSFSCEGPVRLAPSIWNGKAYFGSDDGWAYCVRVSDGGLVWKHRPTEDDRRIPGNGRVISLRPVRTDVLVADGIAYMCAGLFPPDDVYRCALDAETGKVLWQTQDKDASPQGYMLASPTRLFIPTGRTAPFMYDRAAGGGLGPMAGPGGAYALLVDEKVVSGPGLRGDALGLADEPAKEGVASFPCVRMVVAGDVAYLQGKDSLRALNRLEYVRLAVEQRGVIRQLGEAKDARDRALAAKDSAEMKRLVEAIKGFEQEIAALGEKMEACFTWTRPDPEPYALILAGGTLYTGGEGKVAAIRATDGQATWSAEVKGRVYGLSAANGRLYASTDTGAIYCFGAGNPAQAANDEPKQVETKPGAFGEEARDIIEQGGFSKGYCLLIGFDDAGLAADIARASDLAVIVATDDEARANALRGQLFEAGLPPSRATAHFVSGARLPYTTYMANIVVCADTAKVSAAEAYRVLRPYGGTSLIAGDKARVARWLSADGLSASGHEGAWTLVRRGAVEGAGEWTQLYATSSHTACSGETLEGPLGIQWFGEPGPRDIVDRHHRPMSSLFKNGRLFVMGNERIFGVDAYNGTLEWTIEAPGSRRVGALKNSGHALVSDDYLYLAVQGECWMIDVTDGRRVKTLAMPEKTGANADWGYLNSVDDRLFGTGQKSGASFNVLSREMVDVLEGDFRPVVISESAFCLDRHTGKPRWTYRNGAIMNNAITVADNRVFLLENRTEEASGNQDGRMRVNVFCRDAHLVALNAKNGKKVWDRPVKFPFHHIMYLSGSDGILVATGSYNEGGNVYYGLFAYDMGSGKEKWATNYLALNVRGTEPAETNGTHGEQWQHPVIIGDTIYSRPYAFDLKTGEKKDYIAYRGGHGCGGLTGSARYLFGRGSNPRMYPTDVASTEGIPLTLVSRPGCWLNIIPAGGLVMIPESSSGCTCAYPLQTSVVLAPKG